MSRAILYKWEREMRKREEKDAGDVKEGGRAKSVFFKKEKKVVKKIKCKSNVVQDKKGKPKKEKKPRKWGKRKKSKKAKKNEWRVTPVLPDWAVDFLKPSRAKVEAVERGLVLASEEIPLLEEENQPSAQNIFSLTIPVTYHQEEEEKEEMDSMPRFTPQGVSQGGTVDPPSLVGGVKDCLVEVIISQL